MEIDQSKQKQYEDIIENINRKLNALAEVNELQVKKLTDLSSELQQRSVELETVYEHDEQVLSKIRSIVVHDVAYAGLQSPNKTNETKLKNIREEVLTKLTDRLRQSSALSLDDEERSMLQLVQIHLEAEIQTLQSEKEERTRYQRTAEEFGNSQIDYLEQQIQKQINDQRVAESIANEEITKLEDELEERKQNQVTAEVFADKELDKLESQLQEQKDKRRFIEKYASVEILKLEKIIEDKKRSLELAETFAETEISALETKIERKESTLKLVLRFSEAEISRLEDEVNDCLHLKDVLESEATSLRQELADLQHKEVTEIYHSKTHQITALTALDELHNTVSCLQTRIVELETINSRHEVYEQHQLTDNDRRQADAVEELKTRLKQEKMKKMQVVNKLAEIIRGKENELDDMRQRLSTAKRKLQDTETVLTQKMKENTYVLLQMRLDAKESEIEELKCKTPMSEESKIHMEGWLNVSMFGWNKLFVVVSLHHVMFFQNLEEKQRAMPMLVLDIVSIQDARTTTEDEDRELKKKDLSRIFVLVYDAAGEKVQGSSLDKEKKMSGDRTYKGHLFQDVQYRSPKTCDACKKSMWNALQPPPAVKCTGCNSKVHKYHYATDDGSVKPCPRIPIAKYGIGFNLRSLFLQTYSPDMRKAWMTHIMEKVQHLPESKSGHET
ncbi:rho-associated protein kinase 1-like [Mya arenaria]|uniref:rho-associated protein kinase 1-like n=1 Tax=Mya arenaria TaxID=6604 RepID=UPI0022E1BDE2|nr:rho-associated protein kinase 1-like [Mya arenaria]XP_052762471.1 rho-associated protein kinase 1-like [Mya arenaria]